MVVIIHYGEIALKGGNRKIFEDKLVTNLKKALTENGALFKSVKKPYGRIVVELGPEADLGLVNKTIARVFGIVNFSFAEQGEADIEKLKEKAIEILQEKDFATFKVETKRSDKKFPLTSQQVNEQIGREILEKISGRHSVPFSGKGTVRLHNVDLKNPDVTLYVEITDKAAYLYTQKIQGLGGLPAGVSGKAVVLLSGGIDSPVASYCCVKRGVEVVFVHFHSFPLTNQASIDKVKDLAKVLKQFQGQAKIYLIPFADIQKEVLINVKDSLRVILYRRYMLRIAEVIAQNEKALALITGESLGQVASQTLANISAIEEAINMPILRPLISWDKQEIIEKAKQIGTYEISIAPHQDCCSVFLPKFPETKANLREILQAEKSLKVDKLITQALKKTTIEFVK